VGERFAHRLTSPADVGHARIAFGRTIRQPRPSGLTHLAPNQLRGRFGGLAVSRCMPSEQPRLLKPTEVAVQLGVSRTWLYEAAKTGRIPAIRIGGREGPLRFVPEDLQRWIDDARAGWVPCRSARPTRSPSFTDGR